MSMSVLSTVLQNDAGIIKGYLIYLSRIERLHRLLLDVIKDDFERLKIYRINAVQALLIYNMGDQEVSAGELRTRGYYQGSNVSYNLKKLIEGGYLHQARSAIDRRSIKIRLTEEGFKIRDVVADLFRKHSDEIEQKAFLHLDDFNVANDVALKIEKFWSRKIRYIY